VAGYDVRGACLALAARLSDPAVGLPAGIDPQELSPPCAWITPREIRDPTLGAAATLVVWVYLITGNVDPADAMGRLDDQLDGLLEVVDPADSDDVIDLAASVILPANPTTPLPAYRVAVDLDL